MPNPQIENSSTSNPSQDRFALITGASSGIGACFARALAARGRNLVLVARSKDKLDALKSEIAAQHSVRIEIIQQDLSLEGAAQRVAISLTERGIAVDMLVNNAGFGAHGQFWNLPLDRQSEMLRLNIATLTELTYLLLPAMVERRGGGIINISSTASFQPIPTAAFMRPPKLMSPAFHGLGGGGARVRRQSSGPLPGRDGHQLFCRRPIWQALFPGWFAIAGSGGGSRVTRL